MQQIWRLDQLPAPAEPQATLFGSPLPTPTERGPALRFNGQSDGLILHAPTCLDQPAFTLEALFMPIPGGPDEQRFVHVQADNADSRALLELRTAGPDHWYADVFLGCNGREQFLNDPALLHSMNQWHTLALICDGRFIQQWVNGRPELNADFPADPLGPCSIALGMRINQIWWFNGLLHTVRLTHRPLPRQDLLRP